MPINRCHDFTISMHRQIIKPTISMRDINHFGNKLTEIIQKNNNKNVIISGNMSALNDKYSQGSANIPPTSTDKSITINKLHTDMKPNHPKTEAKPQTISATLIHQQTKPRFYYSDPEKLHEVSQSDKMDGSEECERGCEILCRQTDGHSFSGPSTSNSPLLGRSRQENQIGRTKVSAKNCVIVTPALTIKASGESTKIMTGPNLGTSNNGADDEPEPDKDEEEDENSGYFDDSRIGMHLSYSSERPSKPFIPSEHIPLITSPPLISSPPASPSRSGSSSSTSSSISTNNNPDCPQYNQNHHHRHHNHKRQRSLSPPQDNVPITQSGSRSPPTIQIENNDHGKLLVPNARKELRAKKMSPVDPFYDPDKDKDITPRSMVLDVGGRRHKVLDSNFSIFPNTRLGKLVRARTEEDILNLCDGYKSGSVPEFFFDRNWHSFNSILDIYRNGVLHLNTDMCALVLQKDLEYWQIDELILEPCCALKFYPEIEICVKEQKGEHEAKRKEAQRLEDENFGTHRLGRLRTFLWNLMEYPETSRYAQAMAFTSLGVVLISTMTFVLGTFPEFQPESESGVPEEYPEAVQVMAVVDNIAVGFFLIEYVVRFSCAPRKVHFFLAPMNLVDLFAIIPFFLDLVIGGLQIAQDTIFGEDFEIMGKAGKIVRLVRVMRIMRIFKLVRHFAGLQSLIYTLNQAYKELGLLMLLVGVAVLTFSSLVYFAEKDNPLGPWSFLDSFWWGLMTLTTVGYGDLSPSTFPGKLIGGLCALGGIFILTLPIPIVVNSFASYYKNRLWRNEVAHKKRERAKKRREMELLMRDNLLNILTVPVFISGTPIDCKSHFAENGSNPLDHHRNDYKSINW